MCVCGYVCEVLAHTHRVETFKTISRFDITVPVTLGKSKSKSKKKKKKIKAVKSLLNPKPSVYLQAK